MNAETQSFNRPDPDEPSSFKKFIEVVQQDDKPVRPYLLERYHSQPTRQSISTDRYTSRDFAKLEIEKLWPKVWQIACRGNDIPQPGDFVEYEIASFSILVVRDHDLSIKALRNACRHRGMQVVKGHGNASEFNCPYHAWTFGLDGTLKSMPAEWDFKHVCHAESGLMRCLADEFDGYVYINMDLDAEPLSAFLGETMMRHINVHPDEHMWKDYHLGMIVECNWKLLYEAFAETYHIPRTHPILIPCLGDIQTQYDYFGPHSRLCQPGGVSAVVGGGEFTEEEIFEAMVGRNRVKFGLDIAGADDDREVNARRDMSAIVRSALDARGIDVSNILESDVVDAVEYQIFPTMSQFRNPCGHVNFRFRPYRNDPARCIFEVMHLAPLPKGQKRPKDAPLVMIAEGTTFADQAETLGVLGYILNQDVDMGIATQRGLLNIPSTQPGNTMEANILHFHDDIDQYLAS